MKRVLTKVHCVWVGLLVAAVQAAWVPVASAAAAAFCADGSAVYAISVKENTLDRICEEEGTLTQVHIDLGGRQGCFYGISRSDKGGFFLVTEHRIWHWKPGDKTAEFVKLAPKRVTFDGIACSPKNGALLVFGTFAKAGQPYGQPCLFGMSNRHSPLAGVWLRHLTAPVDCAEFLRDGSLLFGTEGDLWHGELVIEAPDKGQPDGRGELVAYRYAPVAERFNDNGTSSQEGVSAIAAGAKMAYVAISRMSGSGWGHLSRLNLPEPAKDASFAIRNGVKDSVRALASVEELEDNPSCPFLCASPDGKRIYFTDRWGPDRHHYLCEDDGEIETWQVPGYR